MYCPDCGNPVDPAAVFCANCGYSVARKAAPIRYAPFLLRVGATLIDLAFLYFPVAVLFALFGKPPSAADMALAQRAAHGEVLPQATVMQIQIDLMMTIGSFMFFTFLAGWLYYTVSECSSLQGTVGKAILKLKVTDLDGRKIGWGRANLRYVCRWISAVPSCLGYLLPLFTEKKQALHDMIAGCLVLRK
jgi:uncharacterized RDD family membrane protein YckC